ncbi:MAG TPA: M23 family metallopeptidase [Chitinophagaceae bacterium]|nr:M23 family metallopeptidase [Chitinophagaceae bacterium]
MQRFFIVLAAVLFHSFFVQAQTGSKSYPKGYFRWPLDLRPEIVANLGELRSNHWHMGLDIRTAQRVNQRVYAAAAGYISKIRIEPFGFGRVIYINHPNGLTTLYAHLNDFFPALEKYVEDQQYKQETWAIELEFTPQQFPVSKGSFIAFSGTTGGSQGPHVHFEIRDTKTDKCLNPLLFGMPLQDNVPPTIVKLAMYNRGMSIYEQRPQLFNVKKTGNSYTLAGSPVIKTGFNKISFAIQAYDRISGSNNQDGIFSAKLFIDGKPIAGFEIDSISYAETGYMNAHIDYSFKHNGGAYLQHLSRLPGDRGPVYLPYGEGTIHLDDTTIHDAKVEIRDAYGNSTVLNFSIQFSNLTSGDISHPGHPHFTPGIVSILEKPGFEVYLPELSLYDTIPVLYYTIQKNSSGALSAQHSLNDPAIPVHGNFTVRVKPNEELPGKWYDKVILQREFGGRKTIRKASYENGFLVADFGDFGNFQAFLDLEPPAISGLGNADTLNLSGASSIVLQPTDNFGIRSFRAELNGEWLRFTNDKGRLHVYKFDERCPYGVHE